jgi:hypothetical protein
MADGKVYLTQVYNGSPDIKRGAQCIVSIDGLLYLAEFMERTNNFTMGAWLLQDRRVLPVKKMDSYCEILNGKIPF